METELSNTKNTSDQLTNDTDKELSNINNKDNFENNANKIDNLKISDNCLSTLHVKEIANNQINDFLNKNEDLSKNLNNNTNSITDSKENDLTEQSTSNNKVQNRLLISLLNSDKNETDMSTNNSVNDSNFTITKLSENDKIKDNKDLPLTLTNLETTKANENIIDITADESKDIEECDPLLDHDDSDDSENKNKGVREVTNLNVTPIIINDDSNSLIINSNQDKNNCETEEIMDIDINDTERGSETPDDIEFVELPCENLEKSEEDKTSTSKSDIETNRNNQKDPIGSDEMFESTQGADEELCIIPDTERIISQAEKEAAASLPPLKDLSETTSNQIEISDITQNNNLTNTRMKYLITKHITDKPIKCLECEKDCESNFRITKEKTLKYLCSSYCLEKFKSKNENNYILCLEGIRVKQLTSNVEKVKINVQQICAECNGKINDEESLSWQVMDFCNEFCLAKYQQKHGSVCALCRNTVNLNFLGKYCVRFGNNIKQFCSNCCLDDFKKGLKLCSYCQRDISSEHDSFLAPVGDKGQFRDFCSKSCMDDYGIMTNKPLPKVDSNVKCNVCKTDNQITIKYETNYFCSDPCFTAFSFVNDIHASKCLMCKRYFSINILKDNSMYYDHILYCFCSINCKSMHLMAHRKIVSCVWCKVKKYNFDMIRRHIKSDTIVNVCSLNCFNCFQVSLQVVGAKKTPCDQCSKDHSPFYHITMSDASIRNFCSYSCVIEFQNKFNRSTIILEGNNLIPRPIGKPKKIQRIFNSTTNKDNNDDISLPVISNVQSLATYSKFSKTTTSTQSTTTTTTTTTINNNNKQNDSLKIFYKQLVVVKPEEQVEQKNASTMCKIKYANKSIQFKINNKNAETQTDVPNAEKLLVTVPVPIFVPVPLPMYTIPVPYPLPFPLPIPVPVFIPTTRNSAKGIMKEMKKIQVKIPTDPYEAELLMMAEMVAGDKKEENTDSESDIDDTTGNDDGSFSPEPADVSNTFGDDMLQIALKMASELSEPAVDLEGALTANTITTQQVNETSVDNDDNTTIEQLIDKPSGTTTIVTTTTTGTIGTIGTIRGRKRNSKSISGRNLNTKKRKISNALPIIPTTPIQPTEPIEKPDAHFCLKYTFGVNAWKQWVTTKNAELEKTSKYPKYFKTEILQLTADELNYSLCLFVKEVRKPNGAEYAPDTIYYLCLGIQQYLFENNRIDNIFCDPYYELFTDSLDEVAKKFSVLYNDSHYIVTRVEEEHLWESKQLGAHSPHVLLSTLIFFNTKHFNLTTVEEHLQLSFSHIMKHWKRNPNQSGLSRTPSSRNVLLRFYPPQSAIQHNSRKKRVYEQQENEENPLRCPVKLYEFYLSKCPESVKTRNDVLYLQPERSCVPDSPVWYSTSPLNRESLEKMLHRVKMVKEINVALLTT